MNFFGNGWVEVGHAALVFGFVLSGVGFLLPMLGWRLGDARLMRSADHMAVLQFLLILLSFLVLVSAYVNSDFSVLNVWQNSHSLQPALYKVTGTWANHEGSMLLWVLILALFGAGVAVFGRPLPDDLRALSIAVQSLILCTFCAFILFTSNPFERVDAALFEGRDLNPILQDIGLAIHPPLLYVGYVGFSITFAFACAALLLGRFDGAWAGWVRPWTLTAWIFLTLGIAMGSWWAYYELGWGGWWFWDPVENASFMPWLVGTAFLHSTIVVEKRDALRIWTVLLAILTFSFSLLGTFLVRSGVLTSVHTFASDPGRGLFILVILMAFIGGSLALFAWRAQMLASEKIFEPLSREGALIFNNIFLTVSCGTVLVGTLYPLAYETLTQQKISIGAPFFNMAVGPLFLVLLAALPFGAFLPWKHADARAIVQRLWAVFASAAAVALIIWLYTDEKASLAPLGLALGFFIVGSALYEPLWRAGQGRGTLRERARRLRGMGFSRWGVSFGHAGVGLSLLGVVCVSAWETETIRVIAPGETLAVKGSAYSVQFNEVRPSRGPTYLEDQAVFTLIKGERAITRMITSRRIYQVREMPTTEAAIKTRGLSQVYISLGQVNEDGTILVRLYWKPYVTLIWLGAIVMALGGLCALIGRRVRQNVHTPSPSSHAVEGNPLQQEGLDAAE